LRAGQKIREQDPLKQGLKLDDVHSMAQGISIREQDPLKQGLKQFTSLGFCRI